LTSWEVARVAARVRALATEGRVRFTLKAVRELAALGLDSRDASEVLAVLRPSSFVERLVSRETGEWMYVFKPDIDGMTVYLKLILRAGCLVVSLHEDETNDESNGSR
jgi:hypothetical protein